ncbi:sigma factor SigX-regulated lipoprotein [Leptospira perolatii]|nr:hypothetical protein [Leptospira perolatii]
MKKNRWLLFLFLLLSVSYCSGNKQDAKDTAKLMALIAAGNPGLSGIYAVISPMNQANGGGGNPNPSVKSSSLQKGAAVQATFPCPAGGIQTVDGDQTIVSIDPTTDHITANMVQGYANCVLPSISLDGSKQAVVFTVSGELKLVADSTMTIVDIDPNIAGEEEFHSTGLFSLQSNNFSANGYQYPPFELSVEVVEQSIKVAPDINTGVPTLEIKESVIIKGKIGEEVIDLNLEDQVYKIPLGFN